MNAFLREKERWHKRPPETGFPRLVRASSEITIAGMTRATDVFNFLLAAAVKAGRGGRGLWRCVLGDPGLVLRKGPWPHEVVEVAEEYRVLRESVPPSLLRI